MKEKINVTNTIFACFYCELVIEHSSRSKALSRLIAYLQNNVLSGLLWKSFSEETIHFKTNLKGLNVTISKLRAHPASETLKNKKLEFILNGYRENIALLGKAACFPWSLFHLCGRKFLFLDWFLEQTNLLLWFVSKLTFKIK